MFEEELKSLKRLGKTKIQIWAEGEYPGKRRTKVQDVAVYQNDGTEYIKPAKFVEKAARQNRYWQSILFRAVSKYLDGDIDALNQAGLRVAYDVNVAVNRIKTGRLKKSFRPKFIIEP